MHEIRKINSRDLKLSDLPEPNIDWHQFSLFALSWNPSDELKDGQFAYSLDMLLQTPTEESSIPEIRHYLYLQQRWWNNRTEDIDNESFQQIREIVELLRKKLQ